jgi:redox-sensitive bicupin YhaK (pirin superfamily)
MSMIRSIRKIVTGQRAVDGAGVKLVRVIGYHDTKEFDPFLMLDAFDSTNPDDYTRGFPWHPHRGIETVTYLVQGDIEHQDSLGNHGSILDGDCQWMTAGSGIIHQEMPKACDRMLGCQLWLNIPAKDKMVAPKYHDIRKNMIPVIEGPGSTVRVIAGHYQDQAGATQGDYIKPLYLDVDLKPGTEWSLPTDPAHTLFIYILQGAGSFQAQQVAEKHAILFDAGDTFSVIAREEGIRFLLFAAPPLREPIAWGGPIVMNTREELDLAFKELDEGKFLK